MTNDMTTDEAKAWAAKYYEASRVVRVLHHKPDWPDGLVAALVGCPSTLVAEVRRRREGRIYDVAADVVNDSLGPQPEEVSECPS